MILGLRVVKSITLNSILNKLPQQSEYNVIVIAQKHDLFRKYGISKIKKISSNKIILYSIIKIFMDFIKIHYSNSFIVFLVKIINLVYKKFMLIIAEVGINHNGDVEMAKKLIKGAKYAGADLVKFQKRTIDKVYKKKTDKSRESPWGTTNREQKEGLEFGRDEYEEIDIFCKSIDIEWFASSWDTESQYFLQKFDTKKNKVASAMLTHLKLVEMIAEEKNIHLSQLVCIL